MSFVIRRLDPAQIRDLVAHTPGGGRTDITLVPGGTPVWSLGVQEHAQIVRRLGGRLDGMRLTIGQDNRTKISSVEGGTGLRMRLGVDAADLVADIRAIAGVLRDETPSPALEFVEHSVPVKDDDLATRLEERLDDMLGEQPDGRVRSRGGHGPVRWGLTEGFRPSKVTFAILLKNGTDLTADTLSPFSQVTLVQTTKLLEAWGVAVEVTGIQAETATPGRAGIRHLAA